MPVLQAAKLEFCTCGIIARILFSDGNYSGWFATTTQAKRIAEGAIRDKHLLMQEAAYLYEQISSSDLHEEWDDSTDYTMALHDIQNYHENQQRRAQCIAVLKASKR